ncbi:SDR family oxidoreductase [Komagataeibacter rhaeticus]
MPNTDSHRNALIIGGSSGIGLATALCFGRSGYNVTISGRRDTKLQRAKSVLQHDGIEKLDLICADATLDSDLERLGRLRTSWEHVVVTAGDTPMGSISALSLKDAYRAMENKFWIAYRVARELGPSTTGSLTLVSGYLSTRPNKNAVLQGAINAAIEALGQGLALSCAPTRVNVVSPGLTETPLWDALPTASRQAMYDSASARLPVGRHGQPDDVAAAIFSVATNTFCTGSVIYVDGGARLV